MAALGRGLKVRYVLQGSVRRTDDRVRVTAQLADADTGTYVWTDRFDREMVDVLLVQDEIVTQIAAKVAGGYGAIERTGGQIGGAKSTEGDQGLRSCSQSARDGLELDRRKLSLGTRHAESGHRARSHDAQARREPAWLP